MFKSLKLQDHKETEIFGKNGSGDRKHLQKLQPLFLHNKRFATLLWKNVSKSSTLLISIDPRAAEWFLMGTPPVSITLLLVGYFILTKYGPKLMANKAPFELNFIMMVYNLFQVVVNLTLGIYVSFNLLKSHYFNIKLFLQAAYYFLLKHKFNWSCQVINYSRDEYGMMEIRNVYWFFLLKVLDLFDTVKHKRFLILEKLNFPFQLFIVMKKKNSQLSFLHCYHHSFMVLGCYMAVNWVPGGHGLLLGLINVFVHGVMYFYFFLTSFKPELKKSIWWKKHITQFQMVKTLNQFCQIKTHKYWVLSVSVLLFSNNSNSRAFYKKLWISKFLAVGDGDSKYIYARPFCWFLPKSLF